MKVKRALIVGGGIAGLATAGGLTREGIDCLVVENAKEWRPVGAGIILNVNAMSAIDRIGSVDTVKRLGFRLHEGAIIDQNGRDLARTNFELLEDDFGPTIALHRADLHTSLLKNAADADIRLGTSVKKIDQQPNGVDVEFTDDRKERFDLVIGADGIDSRVRELAFGQIPTVYSGYTCWRFVVDAGLEQSRMCEMWGRGKRIGVVPIAKGRFYVFAVANAKAGTADPELKRLDRFRKRFSDFGGPAPILLDALEHSRELIHNDLYSVPTGNWYRDRVVLVGDAAHAMTPNMGQGAGMALEDAAVLVERLKAGDTIPEAFEKYRKRREPRVRWVQNQSKRIGQVGQLENPLACRLRNAAVRMIPDRVSRRALRTLVSQPI